jgi:F-type H+-transporting ATPase subunit gamma
MGAQIRVYRQRIRSVQATKKITRAMELIAASRVVKARSRVVESGPYARAHPGLSAWRRTPTRPPADHREEDESSSARRC